MLDLPDRIAIDTKPLDVSVRDAGPGPVRSGDTTTIVSSGLASGPFAPVDPTQPFSADRVERHAYLAAGSSPPRYPQTLRAAGIEGQVTALFVVSETGRVERETVRFTHSDNALFEAAVRDALGDMRFIPAQVAGQNVRQLVQMPFLFTLAR